MGIPDEVRERGKSAESRKHRFQPRPLVEGRKPWFRQNGESVQAYSAFMTYLMLPQEDRKVARAAEIEGKTISTLSKWAQMWSWQYRAASYEEHYLLLKLESVQADRDLMWQEQKMVADLGMQLVQQHFEQLMEAMAPDEKGRREIVMKPDSIARMFDVAAKVQRMAVLGRIEGATDAAEQQEKLAEKYADELADLIGAVVNDIGLTPEQQEKAKAVLANHLVGAKK